MALPVILIDSATGSDTLASGAGPATALTGTSASTSADGLTVTLDGSPDLSNVATDGSHVIFLNDTTAGARNFGKITAKDDVAKTVTVSNAFGLSLSGKSWAIGGKRASLFGTLSLKILNNNGGSGDAMPGWVMEMKSGHVEPSRSTTVTLNRSGDATDGPITIRGEENASTKPLVTFSNNGDAFSMGSSADYWNFVGFEMQNTNVSKGSARAFVVGGGNYNFYRFENMTISHSTYNFATAVTNLSTSCGPIFFLNCNFGYCGSTAINLSQAYARMISCWVHNGAGIAVDVGNYDQTLLIQHCIFSNNGSTAVRAARAMLVASYNTFYNNSGSGIEITTSSPGSGFYIGKITNNIFSNNTLYGINFSGATRASVLWTSTCPIIGNCFYSNTSGSCNPSGIDEKSTSNNPSFIDAANNNYGVSSTLYNTGYPVGGVDKIGLASNTYNYAYPGAAQRQEPAFIAPSGLIARNIGTY